MESWAMDRQGKGEGGTGEDAAAAG